MNKIETLVIATGNPSKKKRYAKYFETYVPKVIGLADLGFSEKPTETGATAEENAGIKAKFYFEKLHLPVFSEDESLFVDFLPKDQQPGVHVRRINGKDDATDEELIAYWEEKLKGIPESDRLGRWHIALALSLPNGSIHIESLEYPIKFFTPTSKIRLPGWPMSSLEGPLRFNKPHSELTAEELESLEEEDTLKTSKQISNLLKSISH